MLANWKLKMKKKYQALKHAIDNMISNLTQKDPEPIKS